MVHYKGGLGASALDARSDAGIAGPLAGRCGVRPGKLKASPESRKRLKKVVAIAESLPEAEAVVQGRKGEHRLLRAGKKSFAYYCFDHHGDGKIALWCKSTPGEQARLVAEGPRRFFVPPYVGPKGWLGVRLDRGSVDWAEVAYLLRTAYRLSAPRRLVARLE